MKLGPEFLIVKDAPQPSSEVDAIIVLSGNADRLQHAADLYNEGLADTMILTNSTESETTKERAVSLGVPGEAAIEEPHAESTYENATFSKNIMEENEWDSALVVTSDYHSRRTKMTFESIYGNEIELTYSFSSSFFDPSDGLNEHEEKMTFNEYVKMIGYSIRLLFE
ncbi:DUF218 domain-containing protein [Halobacillus dabanensis]|uniref:DUF218 domain-containing protein n=1 Tax=Halobacillus dabanensis TaxID=240302 RepID=A0A1I3RLI1_HALDA|nr:YdcF family protein [Halobacillus dabanensis]SFJ46161.1 DUF218 domain-containing protein [Halobacillus dabanensis]